MPFAIPKSRINEQVPGRMKALGDRREQVRLEVVGSLWGTLETNEQARLINISDTGALIESPRPAAVDSRQTVKFMLDGREIILEARVRHMAQVASPGGDRASYQIGLEFLGSSTSLAHALG
jgi:hypothetical protein